MSNHKIDCVCVGCEDQRRAERARTMMAFLADTFANERIWRERAEKAEALCREMAQALDDLGKHHYSTIAEAHPYLEKARALLAAHPELLEPQS